MFGFSEIFYCVQLANSAMKLNVRRRESREDLKIDTEVTCRHVRNFLTFHDKLLYSRGLVIFWSNRFLQITKPRAYVHFFLILTAEYKIS